MDSILLQLMVGETHAPRIHEKQNPTAFFFGLES